jgi:hypothetical protein
MKIDHNYHWARRSIPTDLWTLGELAQLLGVSRHQARRILLKSCLPCHLVAKHWWDKRTGLGFTRKAWALPVTAALVLLLERVRRHVASDARALGVPIPATLELKIIELRATIHTPIA